MASIYGPGSDSQMMASTQPEVCGEAVSVISAGVAYHGMESAAEIAAALREKRRVWQSEQGGCPELWQLQQAAGIEARAARKLDRFSLLALAAARAAILQSKLPPHEMTNCGIYSGNMMGGWTFTEPQVRALHRDGLEAVSPYLATAWFPGAPQGQISIHLAMTGFAKTVTTDRCSGAQAIGLAYERIRSGLQPALLLAGGAEAPVTPFVAASMAQIFDNNECAVEGAAYLLLAAGRRGEVQISGHSTFSVNTLDCSERLTRRMAQLAAQAAGEVPDLVLCNLPLDQGLEKELSTSVRNAFGSQAEIFFTTEVLGDGLAASGALASVAACEMLAQIPSAKAALVVSLGHQCADLLLFSKFSSTLF
jgi:hypothetical protein